MSPLLRDGNRPFTQARERVQGGVKLVKSGGFLACEVPGQLPQAAGCADQQVLRFEEVDVSSRCSIDLGGRAFEFADSVG
jgi:hypothetical protein